jgi:hypothetical protein
MGRPTALLLTACLLTLPGFSADESSSKAKAEVLVSEAAKFARANGQEKLLHAINMAHGSFHAKEPGAPILIVYDGTGKTIAHAENAKHLGMDHSKILAGLFESAKTRAKGWYEFHAPQHHGGPAQVTYFEKVDSYFITCSITQP